MKSYGREGENSGVEIQKTGERSEFQVQKSPLLSQGFCQVHIKYHLGTMIVKALLVFTGGG